MYIIGCKHCLHLESGLGLYEGGIKSNATINVKWQLKVGLHFCLFQIVKIPSLHRYTNLQIFNSILEDFLIVFLEYTSKEA